MHRLGRQTESPAFWALAGAGALALLCGQSALAQAPAPTLEQRVVALKTSLATSQANLRQYEWIETTVVSLNGEEKSRKQQRCYYGADGVLQKVLLDASSPAATKPGLRGRIIANKKAELTAYMQSAVGLVKAYVPPDPLKIQAVKDAGNASIDVVDPGKAVRINFKNYQLPGDNLGVQIDMTTNRITNLGVASYLDSPQDIVTLAVKMGTLNDGTSYASDITLTAQAKNLTVAVQNTGYHKSN
jgi:hypothetical protein